MGKATRVLLFPTILEVHLVSLVTNLVMCFMFYVYLIIIPTVAIESGAHVPLARRPLASHTDRSSHDSVTGSSMSTPTNSGAHDSPANHAKVIHSVIKNQSSSSSTQEVMKTLPFHHITLEHCYARSTHLLGQPNFSKSCSSVVPHAMDNSYLSVVCPPDSKAPATPMCDGSHGLTVERTEHILVAEAGLTAPSLVGFDLGMETESDSSWESMSDSFEAEEQWVPFTLPVSIPQLLIRKATTTTSSDNNMVDNDSENRQPSSPVGALAGVLQQKSLRLPRNGLYLYATRKGAPVAASDNVRQLRRRKGVRFAPDESSKKTRKGEDEIESEGSNSAVIEGEETGHSKSENQEPSSGNDSKAPQLRILGKRRCRSSVTSQVSVLRLLLQA